MERRFRVFVFDGDKGITTTVSDSWDLESFYVKCGELFGKKFNHACFRVNKAALTSTEDLRDDDEIDLTFRGENSAVVKEEEKVKTLIDYIDEPDVLSVKEERLPIIRFKVQPILKVGLQNDENGVPVSGTFCSILAYLITLPRESEFIETIIYTYDLFCDNATLLKNMVYLFRDPQVKIDRSDLSDSGSDSISRSPRSQTSPRETSTMKNSRSAPSIGLLISSAKSYAQKSKVSVQKRIIYILKKQIEYKYSCIKDDVDYLNCLDQFISYLLSCNDDSFNKFVTILCDALKGSRDIHNLKKLNLGIAKISPNDIKPHEVKSILDISPEALAHHLTYEEQSMFAKMKLQELMCRRFSKQKNLKSGKLDNFIGRFNKISYWVATTVVSGTLDQTTKKRSQIISFFVSVIEELMKIRNYNSMMQVFSALHMGPVQKLEKTWRLVPSKSKQVLEDIQKLLEINYKGYRELEDKMQAPCIPLQDLIMRDLTFIEENPTFIEEGGAVNINITKLELISKVFKKISKCQQKQYTYYPDESIGNFIQQCDILSDDELFDLAKKVEMAEQSLQQSSTPEKRKETKINIEKIKEMGLKKDATKKKKEKVEKKKGNKSPSKLKLSTAGDISIDSIVDSPDLYEKFHSFMKTAFIEEALEFFRDVFIFKNMSFEVSEPKVLQMLVEKIQQIYQSYIAPGSDRTVSFSANSYIESQIKAIENASTGASENIAPDLFEGLVSDIMATLNYQLNRWRASE